LKKILWIIALIAAIVGFFTSIVCYREFSSQILCQLALSICWMAIPISALAIITPKEKFNIKN